MWPRLEMKNAMRADHKRERCTQDVDEKRGRGTCSSNVRERLLGLSAPRNVDHGVTVQADCGARASRVSCAREFRVKNVQGNIRSDLHGRSRLDCTEQSIKYTRPDNNT